LQTVELWVDEDVQPPLPFVPVPAVIVSDPEGNPDTVGAGTVNEVLL
jgi:hypothetical protein